MFFSTIRFCPWGLYNWKYVDSLRGPLRLPGLYITAGINSLISMVFISFFFVWVWKLPFSQMHVQVVFCWSFRTSSNLFSGPYSPKLVSMMLAWHLYVVISGLLRKNRWILPRGHFSLQNRLLDCHLIRFDSSMPVPLLQVALCFACFRLSVL